MVAASQKSPARLAALGAARASKNGNAPTTLTLSNGIVLNIKPVPPFAIREAAVRVPPPSVPIVWIENLERNEPNPNDPGYLKALEEHSQDQILAITRVLMILGTSVQDLNGHVGPEDDGWIGPLRAAGMDIDVSDEFARYLSWLQYCALETQDDVANIVPATMRLSGVTDEEVQKAVASFRDAPQRGANNNGASEELDTDGD